MSIKNILASVSVLEAELASTNWDYYTSVDVAEDMFV